MLVSVEIFVTGHCLIVVAVLVNQLLQPVGLKLGGMTLLLDARVGIRFQCYSRDTSLFSPFASA